MNTQKRKVLTIKEAAKLIDGVTEYRIRQMCVSGQLPCFMAGKKYLIAVQGCLWGELQKGGVGVMLLKIQIFNLNGNHPIRLASVRGKPS